MRESVHDSVTRLLRYQRAPARATRVLRTWKHNADLLPRLQAQLEMLLEAYGRFEPIVYDTQGIRDDGTDLVLRYRPEMSDRDAELIGFQVKSFDDLSKKHYMQELKAQRDDSFRKVVGLRHYFLVLCTDVEAHKDRVRSIMAEFRSAERTEVIDPAFAYTFLHHPRTRVEALVKRVMEAEDYVFRLALESVELPSPSARALAVFLVVRFVLTGSRTFTVEQLMREPGLRVVYDDLRTQQALLLEHAGQVPSRPGAGGGVLGEDDEDAGVWEELDEEPIPIADYETQLAEDLETLDASVVELSATTDAGSLRPEQIRALIAVVADAVARYEYDEDHLASYMFSLLGVRD